MCRLDLQRHQLQIGALSHNCTNIPWCALRGHLAPGLCGPNCMAPMQFGPHHTTANAAHEACWPLHDVADRCKHMLCHVVSTRLPCMCRTTAAGTCLPSDMCRQAHRLVVPDHHIRSIRRRLHAKIDCKLLCWVHVWQLHLHRTVTAAASQPCSWGYQAAPGVQAPATLPAAAVQPSAAVEDQNKLLIHPCWAAAAGRSQPMQQQMVLSLKA